MNNQDLIGKECWIQHHDGRESYAGVALEIVHRGIVLVRFDRARLLWPIEQVRPVDSDLMWTQENEDHYNPDDPVAKRV